MGDIFNELLIRPITNLLVVIYHGLAYFDVPYALGFSIIVLTIVIRILLYPLVRTQLQASKKMQKVAPHLSKLKEKHKGDAKRLQQETMLLYKSHGVNPAAGCLPILLQLPLLWALYSVLQTVVGFDGKTIVASVNKLVYSDAMRLTSAWDTSFFGFPLGKTPGDLLNTVGPFVFLVPVVTGVLQYIQSKMMIPPNDPTQPKKADDFATAFQTQSLYILPVMIGYFSYTFPIGLSLYWNTFTIFGILQQYQVNKQHEAEDKKHEKRGK